MSEHTQEAMTLVESALQRVGAEMSAAECHGILAGWLCAGRSLSREDWLAQVVEEEVQGDVLAAEAKDTLDALRKAMMIQLNDSMLEFYPLLPTDDEPLIERVDALGEWCQGFLLGMSLGGLKDLARLSGDSGEAVQDLVQMARAGSYDIEGGEEDEQAYADLVEYVRTAVLMINEELNPTRAPPQIDPTVH